MKPECRVRELIARLIACIVLAGALPAFAQQLQQPAGPEQAPWNWPGPWHMWGAGWGFWWVFPLIMLIMIIACAAMFLLGHRSGGGSFHRGPSWHANDRPLEPRGLRDDPAFSALQILNERLARGEIAKEEYEEKKGLILSSKERQA
jgi:uncharacterized membrane protein